MAIASLADSGRAILEDPMGLYALAPCSMWLYRGANRSSFYDSKDLIILENISNAVAKVQIGAI
jgi:hypothetical protein